MTIGVKSARASEGHRQSTEASSASSVKRPNAILPFQMADGGGAQRFPAKRKKKKKKRKSSPERIHLILRRQF